MWHDKNCAFLVADALRRARPLSATIGLPVVQALLRRACGFTLVEMLAVLAVSTILVALALPSFRGTMARARAADTAAALQASLELARSEAIRMNLPVTVCRSANAFATTPTCSTGASGNYTATDWAIGWVVFAKTGGAVASAIEANDQLLQRHAELSTGPTRAFAVSSSPQPFFSYAGDGLRSAAGPVSMTFQVDWRAVSATTPSEALRCVGVNVTGRAWTYAPAPAC